MAYQILIGQGVKYGQDQPQIPGVVAPPAYGESGTVETRDYRPSDPVRNYASQVLAAWPRGTGFTYDGSSLGVYYLLSCQRPADYRTVEGAAGYLETTQHI